MKKTIIEEKPAPQMPPPSSAEIAEHIVTFKKELDWFYANKITVSISPKPDGWSLRFIIAEP